MRARRDGAFELVVCPLLIAELERAFNYPKVRQHVTVAESHQFVSLLKREAVVVTDPETPSSTRSADPGDDYLLALAAREHAMLVSHDKHLLSLRDTSPIRTADEFLEQVATDT